MEIRLYYIQAHKKERKVAVVVLLLNLKPCLDVLSHLKELIKAQPAMIFMPQKLKR